MDEFYVEGSGEMDLEELLNSRRLDTAEEDSMNPFPYGFGGYRDCDRESRKTLNREYGQTGVALRKLCGQSKKRK